MSDPDPSTFNEFTILNAETKSEKFEAARNIRRLKQEIETWKQKYEEIKANFDYYRVVSARHKDQIAKDEATINSLNEELSLVSRLYVNSITL